MKVKSGVIFERRGMKEGEVVVKMLLDLKFREMRR